MWLRPGGAPNEEDEVRAMEAEVALVADAEDQMGVGMAATPNPTPTSPATTAIAKATTLAIVQKAPNLLKSE